jgi:hypothetical protein
MKMSYYNASSGIRTNDLTVQVVQARARRRQRDNFDWQIRAVDFRRKAEEECLNEQKQVPIL